MTNQPGAGPGDRAAADGSPSDATPGDTRDEVLVAYLDGQLDGDTCESVEARLAADKAFRARLTELDRVWNALDTLPRSTASEAFTRTTVDMVAVAAAPAGKSEQGAASHYSTKIWGATVWGATIGGLVVGAVVAALLATAPERAILEVLPTALHAHALEQAGSVEFLRGLAERADESLPLDGPAAEQAGVWAELDGMSAPERRAWLDQQDAATLAEANNAFAAWQGLTDTRRDTLASFAGKVAAANDSDRLRTTALAYDQLVSRLPASEQSRLRQMDEAERLRSASRAVDRLQRATAMELSPDEQRELTAAVDSIVDGDAFTRVRRFVVWMFPGTREMFEKRPEVALVFALARRPPEQNARWSRDWGDRLNDDDRSRFEIGLANWRAQRMDWLMQLLNALPPRAREALGAEPSEHERGRSLARLVLGDRGGDLASTFEKLEDREIERLLLQPEDQFLEALTGAAAFDEWPNPNDRSGRGRRGFNGPGGGPPHQGPGPPPGSRPQRPERGGRGEPRPVGPGGPRPGPPPA